MSDSNKAVFLSYASQDVEAAQRICEALRASGIEVWIDQSELRGGDAWDQKIHHQIRDCALFIPIVSANTASRPEGYFRLEWALADQRTAMIARNKAFVVPVCIDRTPDSGADVPESFHRVQWTRLPGGETPASFCQRISALLGTAVTTEEPRTVPRPTPSVGRTRKSHRWMAAVAVGLVVAVVAGWQLWRMAQRKTHAGTTATAISAVARAPEKSIAVLPFVDMSEKKDQEYFADGMAEEILNLLATIPDLKVIGRTSSFQFKGKSDDLRKIGTTLGAAYAVEGSVRRSGDQIRVTAQLIDTRSGTRRWSETYDRDANDVLKVQGEIAASLVRALQLEVTNANPLQTQGPLRSSEAYESYLRGLHALNRFDQRGCEEAVAHFRHALEADPLFIPAAEYLARTRMIQAEWGFVPPQTGFEQARATADAALKLDAKSALAHAFLGGVHSTYDFDWLAAAREFKIALALAPNNPIVLLFAAGGSLSAGQWNEALRLLESSLAVDPLGASTIDLEGYVHVRLGRIGEAENDFRRTLDIAPTYVGAHFDLGVTQLIQGKTEAALAEMRKEVPAGGQTIGLAVVYHALHRTKDAAAALLRLEAEHSGDWAFGIAEVYAFRGEEDRALSWLERAYAQKDVRLNLIKGDPLLRNLERDVRYRAFLRKMNLPDA